MMDVAGGREGVPGASQAASASASKNLLSGLSRDGDDDVHEEYDDDQDHEVIHVEEEEEEGGGWELKTIRRGQPEASKEKEIEPEYSDDWETGASPIAKEDLENDDMGWVSEGTMDDYNIDLDSLLVPQHEQAMIRQSAAPKVLSSVDYVSKYVESVFEVFVESGLPQILLPGEEPLSLEGYLR